MTAQPNQSSPAIKAGIYTRISSDPSGQRAGVDRQRADCEAHCLARGWEVAEVFCDNDASAYGRKPRLAYERMLVALESGSIEAIVTWHNDRLHRSPKELEAFIDLVERSGVRLAVVTGGDYDLTTPDGRLSARIVGAVARKESEDRSRRVRRKHLELAELGRSAGQLGWGVRSEDQRELVREGARRVLKGDGLMTIARDWNSRGVPGASGGPWTAPTLRRVLLSSRVAGLREHGVDPSGKTLGDLTPAVWGAALDRQTWDQLRAVLLNPERNTNVRKATRYLLTGLIHCGGCGAALFSRPRKNTRRYLCAGRRPGHQLGIIADPVDELVKESVLWSLTTPSIREALLAQAGAGDDGTMGRTLADLGAAQSRLQGLDDDFYVRGLVAEGRYRSIRVKLEREIDRLHAVVDAGTKQRIVLHPDPRAFWAQADFQQRRDLVRLMIQRVEVMPGRPALRRFDPFRVRIQASTLQPRELSPPALPSVIGATSEGQAVPNGIAPRHPLGTMALDQGTLPHFDVSTTRSSGV